MKLSFFSLYISCVMNKNPICRLIQCLFFFLALSSSNIAGIECLESNLLNDLLTVDCVNANINLRLPTTYNFFLQGGYFIMPSARMGAEGEIGVGFSDIHPYQTYNARFQFLDRLEFSGNYRVFKGVEDPILSHSGFGDKSDKGLNIKFAILLPQDTDYAFPGLAIGTDDCVGTKAFHSNYIVATQVFPRKGLEI